MQSSAILTFSQHDFTKAFQVCSGAPAAFVSVCYESLGRDVSGFTLRNAEKTLSLCRQGSPEQATACLVGAVKDFILTHADPQRGLTFCRRLDDASKEACYAATVRFSCRYIRTTSSEPSPVPKRRRSILTPAKRRLAAL